MVTMLPILILVVALATIIPLLFKVRHLELMCDGLAKEASRSGKEALRWRIEAIRLQALLDAGAKGRE